MTLVPASILCFDNFFFSNKFFEANRNIELVFTYILKFELWWLTFWNFARSISFIKKNNLYILNSKNQEYIDFGNASFILRFCYAKFLKG